MIDESRFRNEQTLRLFYGERLRRYPPELARRAQNKLKIVCAASQLDDLSVPPGNGLEALRGGRRGQWSIRINDQWRICFVWQPGQCDAVEIVDYH